MQIRAGVRARVGWALLGLVAAILVVLVLPVRQIGLGQEQLHGLTGSYLYEEFDPALCPVSNLRCSDIYLPKALRIEWLYYPMSSSGYATYEVQRSADGGSTWTSLGYGTDMYWIDTSFSFSTDYQYRVRVSSDGQDAYGLPTPPSGADDGDIHHVAYASGLPWTTIHVTPMQELATDNQSVDARLDLRYATTHYQNFPFGNRTFRGGLFAGYNADGARVGRSLLKFGAPALPSSNNLWVATVNAYWLRNYAAGSVTVGCQVVGDSWTQAGVNWSTAPSVTPASATATVSVAMTTPGSNSGWVHWGMTSDYATEQAGDNVFSAALASTSESTPGWAYFAKKEYDSGMTPCVLYAYGY